MKQYLLGIDNGGTVIKAAIFDTTGREIAVSSRSTPVISLGNGFQERDMEELWALNAACIRSVLKKAEVPPELIRAVGVSGHGKGLYPWGKDDKPAGNAIASTDNRAWKYTQKWKKDGTGEKLYPMLHHNLIPCQPPALLAWIKENQSEIYHNIKYIFSVKDYIRFRLTGLANSEASDLSGGGMMNLNTRESDEEIFKALGIPEAFTMVPPLIKSIEQCGTITKAASGLTGLIEGTPVAGGLFDIDACAIAMSVTQTNTLCAISGTWSINEFITPAPIGGIPTAMNSIYAMDEYILLEECSPTGAGNLEWFIKTIAPKELSEKDIYPWVNSQVENSKIESSNLCFLPFLYGSNIHPKAKGGFFGLEDTHTLQDMVQAIFEGVVFSHKMHIDRLLGDTKHIDTLRLAGGVTNSPIWVQMFADVLGMKIETVSGVSELGALGSAMAAAVACKIFDSYEEAAEDMVKINKPVMPDLKNHEVYKSKYQRYQKICQLTDNLYSQLEEEGSL